MTDIYKILIREYNAKKLLIIRRSDARDTRISSPGRFLPRTIWRLWPALRGRAEIL